MLTSFVHPSLLKQEPVDPMRRFLPVSGSVHYFLSPVDTITTGVVFWIARL
jgi:hypothetical protein